jgi:glycosyltransferase involved in cell wall biosynthesis
VVQFTIVIPARNASRTIARAVQSAVGERPARIVLVDHASTDDTVDIAHRAGGGALEVIAAPADARLGHVRQIGLDAVDTEFGMWLDADDEVIEGRAATLVGRLPLEGADLAFDEVDLHDGSTGAWLKRLPIPTLLGGRQIVREFERNYLPAVGFPAFRTAAAKAIAFDRALHGAEDVDFLLRAIVAGCRVALVRQVGYRQFAYPSSLSRDIDNQHAMLRTALRKHDPSDVEAMFRRAGYQPRTVAWSMVSFLTLRGDFDAALVWLEAVPPGPRRDFHIGTLLAALGRFEEAVGPLERSFYEACTPELLNNFGVALARVGRINEAAMMFTDAIRLFPGYHDATANLQSAHPSHLTLLALRSEPVRTDYE